jgi:hypothetical protein
MNLTQQKNSVSLQNLYDFKCKENGSPHFWTPQELDAYEYTFGGDFGISETISRVLSLADVLEVEVGAYIGEFIRKLDEKTTAGIVGKLLKAFIKDEAVHAHQIKYALQTYPVSDWHRNEAALINEEWKSAGGHPLQKSSTLEVGVFLGCSLPILLRLGGHSLLWVSEMIAKDEFLHVAGGRGILNKLNYGAVDNLIRLQRKTVAYITEKLNIPSQHFGFEVNTDWFLQQSNELIVSGSSAPLTRWTDISIYRAKFENSNKFMY